MRDFRTFAKDSFLSAAAPWVNRAVNRWVPGCPSSSEQWPHARISYSWDGEDLVAERLLRCLGKRAADIFYVDIGCCDPIRHSNSFLFYQQGASGIAVDPNPSVVQRFRRTRPRDIIVQAAVSETSGTAEFCCYEWDETNAIKGPSTDASDKNAFGHTPREIFTVKTLTLAEVLAENMVTPREIDLLDVDCEGHDLVVLKSNDWSRFRPRVILVEAHGADRQAETKRYLEQNGYQVHALIEATMVFYIV